MTNEKKPSGVRRGIAVFLNVLTYLFFFLCMVALVLSVTAKRDADGAVNLFGMQMRVVLSDSMAKCEQTDVSGFDVKDIPIRSMVFVELVPEDKAEADAWYGSLKAGDVLTFRYVYVTQETITHRITEITEKPTGGYLIYLEGDNKAGDAETLEQVIDTSMTDSPNYVIGKVKGQSYPLGLLTTLIKEPIGIICIVIVPCIIIGVFEVFRLVGALTEGKRKRERDQQQKRDEEFEEMKRQLELLQQQAGMPADNAEATPAEPSEAAPAPETASPETACSQTPSEQAEVQAELQVEVQAEVQAETQAEAQAEVQAEAQAEAAAPDEEAAPTEAAKKTENTEENL